MKAVERVTVLDTTLRDGEQSPGASMTLPQKLQVASALMELGVDVIEAGFPVASPGDFESVREVARVVQGPIICGLARSTKGDIDRAADALKDAARGRIHVFLATSPLHREYKLKMTPAEVVQHAVTAVRYAKERCEDVQFSAEDAARTELDFLAEVVEKVIEAGAGTINIPDTVGYALPEQFAAIISHLRSHVRGIDGVTISVHCHDDLGLAVANSLAALMHGARQVECTINGIGERAGNASLEEVVMALRTRQDAFGLSTGVKTQRLYPTSRIVANMTGIQVQRNKAIVGQNAFAHEAGIHQHGMMVHAGTYEIMRPEDVGFTSSTLVIGKHSGRHSLRERVRELGYQLDEPSLDRLFDDLKILADKKKEIYDADIEALVQGRFRPEAPAVYTLVSLSTVSSTTAVPSAAVSLQHIDGRVIQDAACGDGPVDAVFKAIERITGIEPVLRNYQVASVSVGEDAQGEVSLEVEFDSRRYRARSVNTDIIIASASAFLDAVNRIAGEQPGEREVVRPVVVDGAA